MNLKRRVKTTIFNVMVLTLPSLIIFVLFLEFFVFRFAFPAGERPLGLYDEEYDVMKYVPHSEGVFRGYPDIKGRFSINNYGWNSVRDYEVKKEPGKTRIAIIGDSFIESLQVDIDKALPHIIEAELNAQGYDVESYGFGFSGAQLAQYLQMTRYTCKLFAPDIVIVNVIHNDFTESLSTICPYTHILTFAQNDERTFDEVAPTPYVPNRGRRFLYKFNIVRFLYLNLNIMHRKLRSKFSKDREETIKRQANTYVKELENMQQIKEMTHHAFTEYRSLARAHNAMLLLVMDTPKYFISQGRDHRESAAYKLNVLAGNTAAELGIPFIDLTDTFIDDFNIHHLPFRFKCDGHWNGRAHELAARKVSDFIIDSKWLEK